MSNKKKSTEQDKDVLNVTAALERAAQRARKIAAQTNTPLVIVRDGKLIEEYQNLEDQTQENR